MIPKIKQLITVHDEVNSRVARPPFGGPGSVPPSIDDFLSGFMKFMESLPGEEDDDDEDDDSVPFFGRMLPGARRPQSSSRGKRGRRTKS